VAIVGFGLALTFAVGGSLDVLLAFDLAVGAIAFVYLVTRSHLEGRALPGAARFTRGVLAVAGLGLGVGLWFVQGAFTGDAFFHLGRVR
jgi:hypothetical protein